MTNKVLTIVVPAYNAEAYLKKCVDSMVRPDNRFDDLELLIINDGSKDSTLSIAKELESEFADIIKVVDKPNGGWGSVVKQGVKLASGRYFRVVDSDDWLNQKTFVDYMNLLRDTDADIVATSYQEIYPDKTMSFEFPSELLNGRMSFDKYIEFNDYNQILNLSICTIKTSILKDLDLNLPDRYYADIPFILFPLFKIKSIVFSNLNLYQYWKCNEGQSTSLQGYNSHLDDYVEVTKSLVNFYNSNQTNFKGTITKLYKKDITKFICFAYYLFLSPIYNDSYKSNIQKARQFDKWLKKVSPEFYKLARNTKIRGFIPYIKIWQIFNINILSYRKWI